MSTGASIYRYFGLFLEAINSGTEDDIINAFNSLIDALNDEVFFLFTKVDVEASQSHLVSRIVDESYGEGSPEEKAHRYGLDTDNWVWRLWDVINQREIQIPLSHLDGIYWTPHLLMGTIQDGLETPENVDRVLNALPLGWIYRTQAFSPLVDLMRVGYATLKLSEGVGNIWETPTDLTEADLFILGLMRRPPFPAQVLVQAEPNQNWPSNVIMVELPEDARLGAYTWGPPVLVVAEENKAYGLWREGKKREITKRDINLWSDFFFPLSEEPIDMSRVSISTNPPKEVVLSYAGGPPINLDPEKLYSGEVIAGWVYWLEGKYWIEFLRRPPSFRLAQWTEFNVENFQLDSLSINYYTISEEAAINEGYETSYRFQGTEKVWLDDGSQVSWEDLPDPKPSKMQIKVVRFLPYQPEESIQEARNRVLAVPQQNPVFIGSSSLAHRVLNELDIRSALLNRYGVPQVWDVLSEMEATEEGFPTKIVVLLVLYWIDEEGKIQLVENDSPLWDFILPQIEAEMEARKPMGISISIRKARLVSLPITIDIWGAHLDSEEVAQEMIKKRVVRINHIPTQGEILHLLAEMKVPYAEVEIGDLPRVSGFFPVPSISIRHHEMEAIPSQDTFARTLIKRKKTLGSER